MASSRRFAKLSRDDEDIWEEVRMEMEDGIALNFVNAMMDAINRERNELERALPSRVKNEIKYNDIDIDEFEDEYGSVNDVVETMIYDVLELLQEDANSWAKRIM